MKNTLMILNTVIMITVVVFWLLLRPLPESEIRVAPGHLVSVDPYINAEPISKTAAPVPTNFFMTYVKEAIVKTRWDRITTHLAGFRLRADFSSKLTLESPGDFTERDLDELAVLLIPYMKHDIIKAAMTYLFIEWEETFSRPIVIFHPERFQTGIPLHVGDEIIEVNGEPVETTEDIPLILEPFQVGDQITVKVLRDGQPIEIPIVIRELDVRGRATLGVYLKHRFTFKDLDEDDVIQLDENYRGESGGFMLTLGLIQQLEPQIDLSKGRKIAGTGAITRGGYIMPIRDLDYKVLAAIKERADIFFFPKFQEDQVSEFLKTHQTGNLTLVGVRNIEEAIEYLLGSAPERN